MPEWLERPRISSEIAKKLSARRGLCIYTAASILRYDSARAHSSTRARQNLSLNFWRVNQPRSV